MLGELLDLFGELGVIGALAFAHGERTEARAAAGDDELRAILEMLELLGKGAEPRRLPRRYVAQQFREQRRDPIGVFDQPAGRLLAAPGSTATDDFARLRRRRVNQRVDALQIDDPIEGGAEFLGHRRMAARLDNGDHGQCEGNGRDQRKYCVKLGGNRKLRQRHGPRTPQFRLIPRRRLAGMC